MSYSPEDSAWDEAYERISRELYPEHRESAITEFTRERLISYYIKNPRLLVPATRNFHESKDLLALGRSSAALVFSASSVELFLKSCLLRPVVYGLVHSDALAELVVEASMSQTGFKRYERLLAKLFFEIAGISLKTLRRPGGAKALLAEASDTQTLRNEVIHKGYDASKAEAELAVEIATQVFNLVLAEVLHALELRLLPGGVLVDGAP